MAAQQELIAFDDEVGRALETMYSTPKMLARRRHAMEVAQLEPGHHGLDLGPGPGFLTCELAERVGPTGRVVAIDNSPTMLAMTQQRAQRLGVADSIEIHEGDAVSLPLADGALDFVIASQIYAYVSDIPRALAEAYRVLRPGGRIVIVDSDLATLTIHTDDTVLTDRVCQAWNEHIAHRSLPRSLRPLLSQAGFQLQGMEMIPALDLEWGPTTYSFGVISVMANVARGHAGITSAEVDAWLADIERQSAKDNFLFCLNQYLFAAIKPAADPGC
jgi:ubiquinone/menaquinone biosynthesis C-methylase UbiE